MILLALNVLGTFSLAAARTPVSLDTILAQPIAQRVTLLRRGGRAGYADLAKICFDRSASLKARWRAVTTMGRLDPAYFRASLDRAAVSSEWFLRNAALIALLTDERPRALAASIRALDDSALVVRTQAVRNLIALNARETEGRLWREINARRNFNGQRQGLWIRPHLAEALAKFAGPGRGRDFGRLLRDDDHRLHKWAIRGLERATGLRLSERGEDIQIARGKWLARLNEAAI